MTPEQVINKLTHCGACGGHDEHVVCEINWYELQTWMESVEKRLDNLEGGKGGYIVYGGQD